MSVQPGEPRPVLMKLGRWLGLVRGPEDVGFQDTFHRRPGMMCVVCGAEVALEGQVLHQRWHERLGR